MVLKSTATFDVMRFWGVGSIGGRSLDILPIALPLIGAGLVLGLLSAGSLSTRSPSATTSPSPWGPASRSPG
ncbi:hypothetical protein SVIOM74S_04290 [Streptomyces violarus]